MLLGPQKRSGGEVGSKNRAAPCGRSVELQGYMSASSERCYCALYSGSRAKG